jgi:hypothetical protein
MRPSNRVKPTMIYKLGLKQQLNLLILIVNAAVASLYVWRSSLGWVIPEEKGLNSTTAEPFIWAFAVFPVLAIALLINLIWGVIIFRRHQWRSGRTWLCIGVVWLVAIAMDFAHH